MSRRGRPAWLRGSEIIDLLRLSGPIAISRMSMMLMALTDAIVLGQAAEGELPFILNSWLPMGICLGLGMGLLLGVQVLTSELMGQGQEADSGRIFRRGTIWAIGLGVGLMAVVYATASSLFTWVFTDLSPNAEMSGTLTAQQVADETASVTRIMSFGMAGFMLSVAFSFYLEALRKPLIVTVLSYAAVGVNALIDCALILGWWGMPQLGAEGVAWATTGSRWFLTAVLLVYILRSTPALAASSAAPAGESFRQLKVGIGTAVSNVAEWGGFNMTYIIAAFISLAVNSIYGYTVQVMGVCFMIFLGIGTATSVRVAENFGRQNSAGIQDASRLGVAATLVSGLAMGLIVWVLQDIIPLGLVSADAEIDGILLAPAIGALLIYAAIGTTFDGLQAVASMALRAQGIVWVPTLIHIGSFFIVMLPAGYWLGISLERGAQGMMEAAVLSLGLAAILQWGLLEMKMARPKEGARHQLVSSDGA
ncbi:MAG: MATE family efflux transporter [Pseudomonadota bacterium]